MAIKGIIESGKLYGLRVGDVHALAQRARWAVYAKGWAVIWR